MGRERSVLSLSLKRFSHLMLMMQSCDPRSTITKGQLSIFLPSMIMWSRMYCDTGEIQSGDKSIAALAHKPPHHHIKLNFEAG
jgi:hypothetical protein